MSWNRGVDVKARQFVLRTGKDCGREITEAMLREKEKQRVKRLLETRALNKAAKDKPQ